jgi:hypothetical protein
MASPNLTPLVVAELTLKSLLDGTTSKTVYLSNLALRDSPDLIPVISRLPSVGCALDTYLPQVTRSSLTINNEPGSFGFERRFSDILSRFTPINQSVKIYLKFVDATTQSYTPNSSDIVWLSSVVSYTESHGDPSVVDFQLTSDEINRDVLNFQIKSSSIDESLIGSGIPTQSNGQYLPLVFGESVDVKPLPITSPLESGGSANDVCYVYATTFGEDFPVAGLNDLYVKYEDQYYPVVSASTVSTPLFDTSAGTLVTVATGNDEPRRSRYLSTSGNEYILVQAKVVFLQGSASAEGEFNLEIWSLGPNGIPKAMVGSATRSKADFTWGSGNVTVEFVFDRPIPLVDPNGQYIAYLGQVNTNGTGSIQPSHDNSLSSTASLFKGDDGSWGFHYYNQKPFASAFYGVSIVDWPNGDIHMDESTGLGAACLILAQKSVLTGFESPDVRTLDLVANINGFIDGSSGGGSITGSNGTLLEGPLHVAKLIDHTYNGSAWVPDAFDFTKYSASHSGTVDDSTAPYQRVLSGRIDGPATRDFVFSEICRNSGCRVVSYAGTTKNLAFYAWGNYLASSRTIDEEDCRVRRVEVRGSESIANWLTIRYSANLRYVTPIDFLTGSQSRDLYGTKQLYVGCSEFPALAAEMLGVSNSLFGRRENANPDYRLLNADASVALMLKYLAARYALPDIYVTLEVLDLNKYRALDMMDVITVSSPVLGSYFGTSADADYPVHDGDPVDLVPGEYWRRAEFVRMQIEGREIFFSENAPPGLRLLCRVLNNYPRDPT